MNRRQERERKTLVQMVSLFCRAHHGEPGDGPCHACREFLAYAESRLARCPYGPHKPTCAKCPVHCYSPTQRERARAIMRFAGPRMLRVHPWLAILHLMDGIRSGRRFPPRR